MTLDQLKEIWARYAHRKDLTTDLDEIFRAAGQRIAQSMPFFSVDLAQVLLNAPSLYIHGGLISIHELAQDDTNQMRESAMFKDAVDGYAIRLSTAANPLIRAATLWGQQQSVVFPMVFPFSANIVIGRRTLTHHQYGANTVDGWGSLEPHVQQIVAIITSMGGTDAENRVHFSAEFVDPTQGFDNILLTVGITAPLAMVRDKSITGFHRFSTINQTFRDYIISNLGITLPFTITLES